MTQIVITLFYYVLFFVFFMGGFFYLFFFSSSIPSYTLFDFGFSFKYILNCKVVYLFSFGFLCTRERSQLVVVVVMRWVPSGCYLSCCCFVRKIYGIPRQKRKILFGDGDAYIGNPISFFIIFFSWDLKSSSEWMGIFILKIKPINNVKFH